MGCSTIPDLWIHGSLQAVPSFSLTDCIDSVPTQL